MEVIEPSKISIPRSHRDIVNTSHGLPTTSADSNKSSTSKEYDFDSRESHLVAELTEKGLTPRTQFRKLQAKIKIQIEAEVAPVDINSVSFI
mmetsp:Transcript_5361/g.7420  ORF Transcript_5361/g.7420 Transcript_5361/m.7420 type:complete len:92 (-) Transcript_5361:273-548(-)